MQHIWVTFDKLHVCKRSAIEIDVGKISRITSFTHFHYLLRKIHNFSTSSFVIVGKKTLIDVTLFSRVLKLDQLEGAFIKENLENFSYF